MDNPLFQDVRKIFVGREKELKHLENLFNATLDSYENVVHVLLNAPGVGKSALLHHFGQKLQKNNQLLFIEYNSAMEFKNSIRV